MRSAFAQYKVIRGVNSRDDALTSLLNIHERMPRLLFVDIATAAPRPSVINPTLEDAPDLVEVAWRVFSSAGAQAGKGIYRVRQDSDASGATQGMERALEALMEAAEGADVVVAHNGGFVRQVIMAACNAEVNCTLAHMPHLCLMQHGAVPYRRWRNDPEGFPSLQELREVLTGSTYSSKGDDCSDVASVVSCFWKMLAQDIINLESDIKRDRVAEVAEGADVNGPVDKSTTYTRADERGDYPQDATDVFEAGFYVDELQQLVERVLLRRTGTDQDKSERLKALNDFYKEHLLFRLEKPPSYEPSESPDALLAVAANYLVRGRPTRASLRLSSYVFNRYFPDTKIVRSDEGPHVYHVIPESLTQSWTAEAVEHILSPTDTLASSATPPSLIATVEAMQFLVVAAQLQSAFVHMLRGMESQEQQLLSVYVQGMESAAVEAVAEDLNDLLKQLYRLRDPGQVAPFVVTEDTAENAQYVLLTQAPQTLRTREEAGDSIHDEKRVYRLAQVSTSSPASGVNRRLLTGSHISYPEVGEVRKEQRGEQELQTFYFHDDSFRESLTYLLQNAFRKRDFFPGQLPIINRALQGMDVIGLLPTGGGKSLTYQLAALLQAGTTIVVDPINSLMRDQYDGLCAQGITTAAYINRDNSKKEREDFVDQTLKGELLFLFVGPERFQMRKYRKMFEHTCTRGHRFSYAVIDEAHCVSEWGHDFRQSYLQLADNIQRFCARGQTDRVPVVGLTATASFDVLADVQRELDVGEEAVIALPPKAIDRAELQFRLLRTKKEIAPGLPYWEREKLMGWPKYDQIEAFIDSVPEELHRLREGIPMDEPSDLLLSKEQREAFFGPDENGHFKNAGIIFCPTKSRKLGNGVMAVRDGYPSGPTGLMARLPYLQVSTFFSTQDDETVKDNKIQNTARKSQKNQRAFLANETNLMIATKAFGMGIDKPNVRYTLHYTMPASVESFYQEAGRAGRDREPALCALLYHPEDVSGNKDFAASSFKGIEREQAILNELIEEVRYSEGFTLQYLAAQLAHQFDDSFRVNLFPTKDGAEPFLLFVNGPWDEDPARRTCYGCLNIKSLQPVGGSKYLKCVSRERSDEVLAATRRVIKNHASGGNYLQWLQATSTEGISKRLHHGSDQVHKLLVGFISDAVESLADYLDIETRLSAIGNGSEDLPEWGYREEAKTIVRDAYRFCETPEEFVSNIEHAYGKATSFKTKLYIGEEKSRYIQRHFYKIRNTNDTQRAVYRLFVVGIVDDYVFDYPSNAIELTFRNHDEKVYEGRLRAYLRRYLGEASTEKWIERVATYKDELAEENPTALTLKSYLWTLTEFVYTEMAKKRERAVDYMDKLCVLGLQQGEEAFRQNIIYYFTSKYARMEHLPRDLDQGKKEDIADVIKYIEYIFDPPDGLGGQIDNAKHLRGACARLRTSQTGENATLDLLNAFSLLALAKDNADPEREETRAVLAEAEESYVKGFQRFAQIASWEDCLQGMKIFHENLQALSSDIEERWRPKLDAHLLERTVHRLRAFNDAL